MATLDCDGGGMGGILCSPVFFFFPSALTLVPSEKPTADRFQAGKILGMTSR